MDTVGTVGTVDSPRGRGRRVLYEQVGAHAHAPAPQVVDTAPVFVPVQGLGAKQVGLTATLGPPRLASTATAVPRTGLPTK